MIFTWDFDLWKKQKSKNLKIMENEAIKDNQKISKKIEK